MTPGKEREPPGRTGTWRRKPQLTGPGLAAALQPRIHPAGHGLWQRAVLNHAQDHLDRPVRDRDHGIGQVLHGTLIVADGALHPCLADQEQAVGERGGVSANARRELHDPRVSPRGSCRGSTETPIQEENLPGQSS